MASSRGHRTSVVGRQRSAVERLKSSLFGTDPYVRRRYILDFHHEYRTYRSLISRGQLLEACERADIVFVGDYHALPSCQAFAAELLTALSAPAQPTIAARPLVLFIEMVYARHQRALDEYLAGEIDEHVLRARIHYDRDWGYPWEGYRLLLNAAREAMVPVVAADAPPRSGLRLIRRRDRHAAVKIRERLQADPGARAIVLFGESHMAKHHLPGEVERELASHGLERKSMVVVQNAEQIYWSLARAGQDGAEAVMIDPRRYCVFNASPLAKYESYRQTLLRWSQQEDESPDFGPSLHHLIDLLAGYLGLDRYRSLAPGLGGSAAPLVDLYPEVITRRDRRVRQDPRPRRRRRRRPGIVYRPAPNRIDVYSFSLAAAGEAASRFLLAALRGRAGRAALPRGGPGHPSPGEGGPRSRTEPADFVKGLPFAMTILDEAFVAFAVRYLDPGAAALTPEPGGRARGRSPASSPPRRAAAKGARPGFPDLLSAAAGAPGSRAGARTTRRSLVDRSARLGETLGESVYARLARRSDGRAAQQWLREIARFSVDRSAESSARATRLLYEAALHAGMARHRSGR